ncbi:uncharacterized protein MONOS_18085 [Monocercomonoides exilis]|uniref:uncharacterized protein n=1 Tax=Monocercomonoides exilis TaxID=2049356 RepID=UPI0035597CCD|nr:hypothetical protein MONOS_18085 [Monocercomonoides exilis]
MTRVLHVVNVSSGGCEKPSVLVPCETGQGAFVLFYQQCNCATSWAWSQEALLFCESLLERSVVDVVVVQEEQHPRWREPEEDFTVRFFGTLSRMLERHQGSVSFVVEEGRKDRLFQVEQAQFWSEVLGKSLIYFTGESIVEERSFPCVAEAVRSDGSQRMPNLHPLLAFACENRLFCEKVIWKGSIRSMLSEPGLKGYFPAGGDDNYYSLCSTNDEFRLVSSERVGLHVKLLERCILRESAEENAPPVFLGRFASARVDLVLGEKVKEDYVLIVPLSAERGLCTHYALIPLATNFVGISPFVTLPAQKPLMAQGARGMGCWRMRNDGSSEKGAFGCVCSAQRSEADEQGCLRVSLEQPSTRRFSCFWQSSLVRRPHTLSFLPRRCVLSSHSTSTTTTSSSSSSSSSAAAASDRKGAKVFES